MVSNRIIPAILLRVLPWILKFFSAFYPEIFFPNLLVELHPRFSRVPPGIFNSTPISSRISLKISSKSFSRFALRVHLQIFSVFLAGFLKVIPGIFTRISIRISAEVFDRASVGVPSGISFKEFPDMFQSVSLSLSQRFFQKWYIVPYFRKSSSRNFFQGVFWDLSVSISGISFGGFRYPSFSQDFFRISSQD